MTWDNGIMNACNIMVKDRKLASPLGGCQPNWDQICSHPAIRSSSTGTLGTARNGSPALQRAENWHVGAAKFPVPASTQSTLRGWPRRAAANCEAQAIQAKSEKDHVGEQRRRRYQPCELSPLSSILENDLTRGFIAGINSIRINSPGEGAEPVWASRASSSRLHLAQTSNQICETTLGFATATDAFSQ